MSIFYTDEQKNKLKKAFGLVLDDIRELWNATNDDNYIGWVDLSHISGLEDGELRISSSDITLFGDHIYFFEIIKRSGKVVRPLEISRGKFLYSIPKYNLIYEFINNYDEIRGLIKEKVEISLHGEQDFKSIDSVIKKYDKEASIEINMPTQNQQQIKVDYVDGKTVGVLDFGDRTIKIVTNGSIVLVDKEGVIKEESKSKIKI